MNTAEELKQQLAELSAKRSQIENDVSLATARLEATGMGMDTPLVDAEGFPRADVDIPAIRTDRQKVRVLSNDHKELSTQIEILLHRLHALSRDSGSATLSVPSPSDGDDLGVRVQGHQLADPIAVPSRSIHPFAEIDEVSEGSPAATAGLRVGDLMVSFGRVTAQTPNVLQAVAAALAASEGKPIETVVLRSGVGEVKLTLVPQQWGGRGLLGCHLQPLRHGGLRG